MTVPAPGEAIAEQIAAHVEALRADAIPPAVAAVARRQLIDVAGLCIAARESPYVAAILESDVESGTCTVIGHEAARSASRAAIANGAAAHGEDYDDTFEGTPVHAGAVIVPAVLAACEREGRRGADCLKGMACGVELMCRMALVAPAAIHRAGFHPTAVIGAMGAALGVGAALGLDSRALAHALGVAGSLAAGIIEYLAEGTWTKRLHAGWAAHCGIEAVCLARAGFRGPRTVMEGTHGFFEAFTDADATADFTPLTESFGERWLMENVAFKPHACGTMAQPFVDCALALRASGVALEGIAAIDCDVGEGTVHRLWEPLAEKRRPPSAYAAKFSVPYCVAVALVDGAAGLGQFTEARIADPRVLDLAGHVGYRIDPHDEYPANYTGHIRVRFKNGTERELRQPHLRGGRREPLSDAQLAEKYLSNTRFGGWVEERAARAEALLAALFEQADLAGLSTLRG